MPYYDGTECQVGDHVVARQQDINFYELPDFYRDGGVGVVLAVECGGFLRLLPDNHGCSRGSRFIKVKVPTLKRMSGFAKFVSRETK